MPTAPIITDIPFSSLEGRVSDETLEAIEEMGFSRMTELQAKCISPLLEGNDVVVAAKTGSGKTLAFLIPAIETLLRAGWEQHNGTGVLIISPTIKRCWKTYTQFYELMENHPDLSHDVVTDGANIGGKDRQAEEKRLSKGVSILVAMPGQLLAHLQNTPGFVVRNLKMLIVDGADCIIDAGFEQEMHQIVRMLPQERQSALFSATRSPKVDELVRSALKATPVQIGVMQQRWNATYPDDFEEEEQEDLRQMLAEIEEMQKEMVTISQNQAQQTEAGESANRQAEIVQVEQEKAKLHAELGKKMAKIVEMHKEVEAKSEQLAEKAGQINALLVQLIQSISQLSLEIWYDWLGFVPRCQLGEVVPQIGDLRFASILQKFLHEYNEITIDHIRIVQHPFPCGPRVMAWRNERQTRVGIKMAETQMPANITNFTYLDLSYFDRSVLKFIRKFQQNGLLDNVTLLFSPEIFVSEIQPVLCHLLSLVNGIDAVDVGESGQLVEIYNTLNMKGVHEMNMKMMEKTRLLAVSYVCDPGVLRPSKIELYCRWLYQTARADGKPRVLVLYYQMDRDYSPVYLFIDRIKQDFLMATDPATFFIRIDLPEKFQLHEDINLDNGKTNERLLTKTDIVPVPDYGIDLKKLVLQISRYPRASTNKWIVENEKEVSNWNFDDANRKICLPEEI